MDDSEVERLDKLVIGLEKENEPEEDDQTEVSIQQQSYVSVLIEEEIWELMEEEIQRVSDTYSISKSEATLLLPHFRWDDSEFNNKWFDDAKRVRDIVGLLERPLVPPSDDKEFFCGLCCQTHPLEKSASVSCSHRVCTSCWTSHINIIINETPDWNLRLKCPYVSCRASIGRDMIERFASEEEKTKYHRYLLKSYVEDSKKMKLCPRVASGHSCTTDLSPDSGNSAVYCVCLLGFCWNYCSNDVHSPVDCETAAKWFCCGDWIEHGEETCYTDAASYEETDQERSITELSADRFKDCYENWESNDSLMKIAKAKLEKLRSDDIPNLSYTQSATERQLKFLLEAVAQIMEYIRVLKWTYAYEYYLLEDEAGKQAFLKHMREIAEDLLKTLDYFVETELSQFLDAEGPLQEFNTFRIKLTELTSITRKHNESLVRDLEDGLSNVVSASEMSSMYR